MSFTYCEYVCKYHSTKVCGSEDNLQQSILSTHNLSAWDFKLRSSGLAARTFICHFSLALICSFLRQVAYNPFEKPFNSTSLATLVSLPTYYTNKNVYLTQQVFELKLNVMMKLKGDTKVSIFISITCIPIYI